MSKSHARDAVALTGADCMLRAFDREARRYHSASHASQLVLRLGAGFDCHAFAARLERAAAVAPILRAPIRRSSIVGPPIYDLKAGRRAAMPRVRVHESDESHPQQVPECFFSAMNEPFDLNGGELLRVDVVSRSAASADIAFTWTHMLLDGTGSELFVAALAGDGEDLAASVGDEHGDRPGGMRERGLRARHWQRAMQRMAARPPASLGGQLRAHRQRLRYRLTTFDRTATARVDELAKSHAGFLTPVLYYMAACILAHHRVFLERGSVPASYVVPLPVNVRPRGRTGAVFRTHVSILWFQVSGDDLRSFEVLLSELKRQRHEAIRDGLVEKGIDAMDFARYVPADVFRRVVRNTLGGELCSFFFAYTGDFLPQVDTFFGAPIDNGFHAPAVLPSPGSCAAMSVHRGRLNLTHVYQDDALSEREVEMFAAQMRRELQRTDQRSD